MEREAMTDKGPKLCTFCDRDPGHDGPHLPPAEALEVRIGKAALNGWVGYTIRGEARSFDDNHAAAGAAILAMDGVHTFDVPAPDPTYSGPHWPGQIDDGVTDYLIWTATYTDTVVLGVTGAPTLNMTAADAIELGQKLIAAGLRGIEVEKGREDATEES